MGEPLSSRPAPVRIDDLASPRFAPEIDQIRTAVAGMAADVRLEPDFIIGQAAEATGFDPAVLDDAYRQRLDLICRSWRAEAGLSAFGVFSNVSQLTGMVSNKLVIDDLLRRHPEIHDIEIERPIIICGLPRTGTTHLHNLMSADPQLRSLPYWESLQPALSPAQQPGPGEPDPRIARTDQAIAMLDASMPLFKRMHEMTTDHVHEEIQLLAIDLSTMLFETMAWAPSVRDFYLAQDQTPHYEYMKTVLKVMTFLRGGTRWVLKSPQHLEQFGPLRTVFPDATYVVTHRDPVSVVVSMVTMIAYGARMSVEQVDPVKIGRGWADRLERMLQACVRDRHLLPADQSLDVFFHEFMADDMATVHTVYERAGQPLPESSLAAMAAYMEAHPRGRHGTVIYEPEQFGLDLGALRDQMRFYTDRFPVALEDGVG